LLRIGALGPSVDDHLAVEYAAAAFADDSPKGFSTRRLRRSVIDAGVIIHMLSVRSEEDAKELTHSSGFRQINLHIVTYQAASEIHITQFDVRISREL
jgi:hypothetical protein